MPQEDPVSTIIPGESEFVTNDVVVMNTIVAGATDSRYIRKIVTIVNSTTYTLSTSNNIWWTSSTYSGFKGNSLLKIYYMYPHRNDLTASGAGWGGLFFEPQIKFDSDAWQSLGNRGFDIMNTDDQEINKTSNQMFINPGKTTDFSVQIRFNAKSYFGVGILNGSHDINNISGTASLMSGNNGLQHYGHWIIEELAKMN
jgi:hypothetical protein